MTQVCKEEGHNLNITNRQWMLAENVASVLEVFKASTLMASTNNASTSVVIRIVNCLCDSLKDSDDDDQGRRFYTIPRSWKLTSFVRNDVSFFFQESTNILMVACSIFSRWNFVEFNP